ncbi:unnamed protein product [Linum trigynum]|uniref:Uncharacterized protein n=1 Tax=Linum trigynum TaxID=586398 RepID=A0AAV2C755_9ROSI
MTKFGSSAALLTVVVVVAAVLCLMWTSVEGIPIPIGAADVAATGAGWAAKGKEMAKKWGPDVVEEGVQQAAGSSAHHIAAAGPSQAQVVGTLLLLLSFLL